jgi:hypothetical protein
MEPAMPSDDDSNPLHHTRKMRERLRETMQHLRDDVKKVEEPQFKAMFETAAEVLGALAKTFEHYERQNEPAWRRKGAA